MGPKFGGNSGGGSYAPSAPKPEPQSTEEIPIIEENSYPTATEASAPASQETTEETEESQENITTPEENSDDDEEIDVKDLPF